MRWPQEPEGWRDLQTQAQREDDPQRLASIIDEMNRLLDRHERRSAHGARRKVCSGAVPLSESAPFAESRRPPTAGQQPASRIHAVESRLAPHH
jgi:hypothetical protein